MAELRTIARPYAKAAFQQAVSGASLASWSDGLKLLAQLTLTPEVAKLIASPAITSALKAEKLLAVCGEDFSAQQKNFVSVLAENKRLELLPEIFQLFDEYRAEQESSVNVVVNTAFPLDTDSQNKLAAVLKNKLQRDVTVETAVDKSLLGGVLIKAGDTVIDGSIKGRLAKLAEAMNS